MDLVVPPVSDSHRPCDGRVGPRYVLRERSIDGTTALLVICCGCASLTFRYRDGHGKVLCDLGYFVFFKSVG